MSLEEAISDGSLRAPVATPPISSTLIFALLLAFLMGRKETSQATVYTRLMMGNVCIAFYIAMGILAFCDLLYILQLCLQDELTLIIPLIATMRGRILDDMEWMDNYMCMIHDQFDERITKQLHQCR